jgi:hypothetical protein
VAFRPLREGHGAPLPVNVSPSASRSEPSLREDRASARRVTAPRLSCVIGPQKSEKTLGRASEPSGSLPPALPAIERAPGEGGAPGAVVDRECSRPRPDRNGRLQAFTERGWARADLGRSPAGRHGVARRVGQGGRVSADTPGDGPGARRGRGLEQAGGRHGTGRANREWRQRSRALVVRWPRSGSNPTMIAAGSRGDEQPPAQPGSGADGAHSNFSDTWLRAARGGHEDHRAPELSAPWRPRHRQGSFSPRSRARSAAFDSPAARRCAHAYTKPKV